MHLNGPHARLQPGIGHSASAITKITAAPDHRLERLYLAFILRRDRPLNTLLGFSCLDINFITPGLLVI